MEDYKLRDLRASHTVTHTGLVVELEHLKIKTRLTNLFGGLKTTLLALSPSLFKSFSLFSGISKKRG